MREAIIHKRASFLRDAVFAASDGLVTTFAVVAGAQGATLGPDVVLILGFANLFADGISMSSGAYLGVKSEMEFEKTEGDKHFSGASPIKQAFVTFFAFDIAGLLPLLPFLFRVRETFLVSSFLVAILLFLVGIIKSLFTRKSWIRSGMEMSVVGGLAAFSAYAVGYLLEKFVT